MLLFEHTGSIVSEISHRQSEIRIQQHGVLLAGSRRVIENHLRRTGGSIRNPVLQLLCTTLRSWIVFVEILSRRRCRGELAFITFKEHIQRVDVLVEVLVS